MGSNEAALDLCLGVRAMAKRCGYASCAAVVLRQHCSLQCDTQGLHMVADPYSHQNLYVHRSSS